MNIDTYHQSFERAQTIFEGRLEQADRSSLVTVNNNQSTANYVLGAPDQQGFYPIDIELSKLQTDAAPFIGRTLLAVNTELRALSPAVITADPNRVGQYEITMLQQPYDPRVGYSEGMRFGLSAKAQTRVRGYGGHGQAGAFEQGHMGAVLLGARSTAIGEKLVAAGDQMTHQVLNAGTAETFSNYDMLGVKYVTRPLPTNVKAPLRVYWHEKLPDIAGDYPQATTLMLGAGMHALGRQGLDKARRLVGHAIRGAQ